MVTLSKVAGYRLYNVNNVKKTRRGVLSNTPPWVCFTFFKLSKWYQNLKASDFVVIPYISHSGLYSFIMAW